MEFGVFGGFPELFSEMEIENLDSYFNSNGIGGVTENNVFDTTNADNNVVSAGLKEQGSIDDSFFYDIDEVMENFRKSSIQIADEKMISQKDKDAITAAALLEIKRNLGLDSDDENEGQENEVKEVYEGSCPGKKHVVDVEQYDAAASRGFMTSGGTGASWRTPGIGFSGGVLHRGGSILHGGGNHPGASWDYVNRFSAPFSDQSLVLPAPWSHGTHGVLGITSMMPPSYISSSSSPVGGSNPPSMLLGGLVDVSSFQSTPTSSKNNTSMNNHGVILEQPSSFPSPFSSSAFHSPAQGNDIPQGVSTPGTDAGAIPGKKPPPVPRSKKQMERSKRGRNMSDTESSSSSNKCSSSSQPKPLTQRRRKLEEELPSEYMAVQRIRQNGKTKGKIDKYYYDLTTSNSKRHRSKAEMIRSHKVAK